MSFVNEFTLSVIFKPVPPHIARFGSFCLFIYFQTSSEVKPTYNPFLQFVSPNVLNRFLKEHDQY